MGESTCERPERPDTMHILHPDEISLDDIPEEPLKASKTFIFVSLLQFFLPFVVWFHFVVEWANYSHYDGYIEANRTAFMFQTCLCFIWWITTLSLIFGLLSKRRAFLVPHSIFMILLFTFSSAYLIILRGDETYYRPFYYTVFVVIVLISTVMCMYHEYKIFMHFLFFDLSLFNDNWYQNRERNPPSKPLLATMAIIHMCFCGFLFHFALKYGMFKGYRDITTLILIAYLLTWFLCSTSVMIGLLKNRRYLLVPHMIFSVPFVTFTAPLLLYHIYMFNGSEEHRNLILTVLVPVLSSIVAIVQEYRIFMFLKARKMGLPTDY